MSRRTFASACLAVSTLVAGLVPGLVAPVAASSCSAWSSETAPPPTIRVFRHVPGVVQTVNFKVYARNVLSREWIGSWSPESLRSGALMVRNYAWYQVLHWRGGVDPSGACFDLRDDTWDQVYDPSLPTWSTAAAAVDSTWSAIVHRDGHIFPTYYNAGASIEACGANANGWKAYQWGTQACGLAGLKAAQIVLMYYYPGVTVSGLAAPSPPPSPTATPRPSPTPTPTPRPTSTPTRRATPTPTPKPGSSASAGPSPSSLARPTATPAPIATPRATSRPTPSPTARPTPSAAPSATPGLPGPPANQQLPGGGQASVANASEPPPPPPQHPKPMVATRLVEPDPITWSRETGGAGASGPLENPDPRGLPGDGSTALAPRTEGGQVASGADLDRLLSTLALPQLDARLLTFRERLSVVAEAFLRAVARELAGRGPLAALLTP